MTTDRFEHQTYTIRKKVFKVFGGAFHIYDPMGQIAFYSKMAAFKLKEDIRLYTGEDMQTEVLVIQARQILDIAATYDVYDSATNMKIGALRRKGLKSILKDEWIVMGEDDREIGLIKEDSMALALVRRFLTNLIPQTFIIEMNGAPVCTLKQRFNPFILKLDIDFSPDVGGAFDKRMGIAAAILLSAIEGRQQ
jgi:uncharacterized protein YxjI